MGILCKIIHHHHVEFFPSNFGRPMIRSIETSSQLWICMANGSRWPRVLIVSPLLCWQTKHSTTKFEHQFSYLDVSMWVPIQSQRIHHLFMSCYPYLLMKCYPYPLIRFQCERNSIIWDVYIHALYVCIFGRISIENHLYIFHHESFKTKIQSCKLLGHWSFLMVWSMRVINLRLESMFLVIIKWINEVTSYTLQS
jgi:hypothetical protein